MTVNDATGSGSRRRPDAAALALAALSGRPAGALSDDPGLTGLLAALAGEPRRMRDLVERLKQKRYRAKLVKRHYIPKGNGQLRPLGIPAVEDKLLQVAARRAPFAEWAKHAEVIAPRKTEKLDFFLNILYVLLEDVLLLAQHCGEIRNVDIRRDLEALASHVSFDWIRAAVKKTDELSGLVRRNIQKNIALDALVMELRRLG